MMVVLLETVSHRGFDDGRVNEMHFGKKTNYTPYIAALNWPGV